MKRILLLTAWALIQPQLAMNQTQCGFCDQDAPVSATEELKKLDRQLDDAYIRGDKALFESILAEEMISVSPEGDVERKKDLLSQINPPRAGLKVTLEAEDLQVYLFADAAIVTASKTLKRERNDRSSTNHYRETNTYVRKDGRWQLISSQQAHEAPPYSAKDIQNDFKIDAALLKGNKKASVVLVEFSDYQCPYCRQFSARTMKQIEKDYIDTGKVGFIFRDFPLEEIHPYAFKAAEAGQCAQAQGKLWEMNQRLFQEPMALKDDDLLAHAQALTLDMAKFRQCLSDEKTAAALRQQMQEAVSLGVRGTPIFLIGVRKASNVKALRMIEGGYPYEVFKATLDTIISAQSH